MKKHFSLIMLLFLCVNMLKPVMVKAENTTIEVNVGVIVDFDTLVGKMAKICIDMALSEFYDSHSYYKTRLILNTRDSMQDVVVAAASALDLIRNVKVQAIIGPQRSTQANFLINLGDKAKVPIISFSATSPFLTSIRSPYFIRATQNDSNQVKPISAIVKTFGWREAVLIYVDDEYGEGIIPYLTDALQEINTRVPYRSIISPSISDVQISEELYKLMTMPTRVFIVHMLSSLGVPFFSKVKEVGMMNEGYVWIVTDGITNVLNSMNSSVFESMQGVLGVKTYVPKTKELEYFRVRWKRQFQQEFPTLLDAELNIYGLRAYDATIALAMAVEKIANSNIGFQMTNVSNGATDLEGFGVSNNGENIIQELSKTRFKGLAGDFRLVDGQLDSSDFQIINVNGNGWRGIGFWKEGNGIVRKLNSTNPNPNLAPILWPGDSTFVPKGWEIPTNGKKLVIGVPVKDGFSEFVKVTKDSNNVTDVTGYCIDIFKAVINALPYAVPYEFVPFAMPNGQSAGTYNDLIYQVYLEKYDAVVGDITIIANRSLYVDFTMPYTESGVSMIVQVKDSREKNAWVFLKPLSWDLWVTSTCFFVFIGFVVWVLEHRINEDFRGPPSHQIGTSFWFSFSTMVFAHREQVLSNSARIVVIIWCFVVLILTQSYTASLTSLLTVQQLRPTITDVKELIKNGENVGYQEGSFVNEILLKLGFDAKQLKVYNSIDECNDLFSKGSAKGGIAAAFDEVPYMKLFLAQHCSKYTMIEPTFKTDGFGFVFPKGSPLVPDISRAVLNITEGDIMEQIEKAWFGNNKNCPDPSSLVSSDSLGLDSFWGLFLLAGIASILALCGFIIRFLYQHRHLYMNLGHLDPQTSIRKRIHNLFEQFVARDETSHTFRESVRGERSVIANTRDMGAVEMSPRSNVPVSPMSCSNLEDLSREEGIVSVESGNPSSSNDHVNREILSAENLDNREIRVIGENN